MSPGLRGGPNTKLRTVVWKLDSNSDDWWPQHSCCRTTPALIEDKMLSPYSDSIRCQADFAEWLLQSVQGSGSQQPGKCHCFPAENPFVKVVRNKYVPLISSRSLISVTRKTKCRHGQQLVPGLARRLVSSKVSLPLSLINNTRTLSGGWQNGGRGICQFLIRSKRKHTLCMNYATVSGGILFWYCAWLPDMGR